MTIIEYFLVNFSRKADRRKKILFEVKDNEEKEVHGYALIFIFFSHTHLIFDSLNICFIFP